MAESLPEKFDRAMENLQFSLSLEALWELIRRANRCVEENKPWELAKDEAQKERLATVLYSLAEALRLATVYLSPFLPTKTEEMRSQLGLAPLKPPLEEASRWGGFPAGTRINLGEPLFPRVELPPE
jgi:methionyl-tRNA synthetase